MLLSNAAIKNRTTVMVLIVLVVISGVYSYMSLPRESSPDVKIPFIFVTTTRDGVSPEDMESSVTAKIEDNATGLNGIKEIRSTSAEGLSTIIFEFLPEVDSAIAMRDVKDKVDLARKDLPKDIDEPVVTEINLAEIPIINVTFAGDVSPVKMKAIADLFEDTIKAKVKGILDVTISGDREREIRLVMDPDRIAAYGLTVAELYSLIQNENVNISAGGMETEGTSFNIRVPAEFTKPEDVGNLPLTMRDGKTIYLADVATVIDTFKDRTTYSRLNGKPSVTVSISKRIGENIVRIAGEVRTIVEAFRLQVPSGVTIGIPHDASRHIDDMVKDLENSIFSALVLVMIVLVAFMGFRTSMIVAVAIPMSMLISFAIIQLMGYTLNMIVLFSLILALGMLVDNAIVIVENIYRHQQMGYSRAEAAMKGTGEVAWPVISSTATTLAAFSPLIFWPGMMGDFMKYLPITLVITLTSSLFVALIITPTVCSLLAASKVRELDPNKHHPFVNAYRASLGWTLQHKAITLTAAALLLVGMCVLYGAFGRGVQFMPELDPRNAMITVRAPQGTNIQETNRIVRIIEERIKPYAEYFENVVTTVGVTSGDGMTGGTQGPHLAEVKLIFYDFATRTRPSKEILNELRKEVSGIAGAEIRIVEANEGPPTGAPITVRISGDDFDILERHSKEAEAIIAKIPDIINLKSDYEASKPELPLIIDRVRAREANISTAAVGNFLKAAIFGMELGKYRHLNDEYDITVRLPLEQRQNLDDLLRLDSPNEEGTPIPLSSLGNFEYRGGYGTIRRVNHRRVITLTADVQNEDKENEVLKKVQDSLSENLTMAPGYELSYAGKKEEQDKASAFLSKAFVIALLLIVIILVMQFNTLSAPFIIMTTVILSLIGVFIGLLVCNMHFGIIMTGIGVISLAGVVVNNAIVLLDCTRSLQKRGMEVVQAAVQAGATRLRPVLLTATTTILGLIPMALGVSFDVHTFVFSTKSESSQWWASMAIAVIFGLAFATVLTLIVVPTLYVSLYKMAARFGLGGLHRPEGEHEHETTELEDY